MSKPKILVCVICRSERDGWVNPSLCAALLELQRDSRFDLHIKMANHPWRVEYARNKCMADAREYGVDFLIQIDNDIVLPSNFGDIVQDATTTGKVVVCLAYGIYLGKQVGHTIIPDDYGFLEGDFRTTGSGLGGAMIIHSVIWKDVPGPWFRWLVNNDELQTRLIHEDQYFADLVSSCGFKVWTHEYALAGHLKTTNITKTTYDSAKEEKKRAPRPTVYMRYPPPQVGRPTRIKPPTIADAE